MQPMETVDGSAAATDPPEGAGDEDDEDGDEIDEDVCEEVMTAAEGGADGPGIVGSNSAVAQAVEAVEAADGYGPLWHGCG